MEMINAIKSEKLRKQLDLYSIPQLIVKKVKLQKGKLLLVRPRDLLRVATYAT